MTGPVVPARAMAPDGAAAPTVAAVPAGSPRTFRPVHWRSTRQHAIIWLWALLFFLLTTPFYFWLSGIDPAAKDMLDTMSNRREAGSQTLIYVLRAGVLCLGIMIALPYHKLLLRGLLRLLPLVPFIIWASCSLYWTDQFDSTLHGLVGMAMIFLCACLASVVLLPEDVVRALLLSGLLMALASFAFILLVPALGVHQANDASQSVHAGAWRGVYQHKNHLGPLCAVYMTGIILAGKDIFRSSFAKWTMVVVLGILLAGTRSASALVVIPVAIPFAWVMVRLQILAKFVAIIKLSLLGAGVLLASQLLLTLLGRDASLTGRTTIWETASDFISRRPVEGYGFLSSSYQGFAHIVETQMSVRDPHNAYLDMLLGVGFVGLALFYGPILYALFRGRRLYIQGGGTAQAVFVLAGLLGGWLLTGITESNSRPFGAVAAVGIIAMTLLLCIQGEGKLPGSSSKKGGKRPVRASKQPFEPDMDMPAGTLR